MSASAHDEPSPKTEPMSPDPKSIKSEIIAQIEYL